MVHPEAIFHGLVQWRDGALTAGLALPDMKVPIANALRHRERLRMALPRLDLAAIGRLTFENADETRFPCLSLARAALRDGGAMPTVLNAANEIAVSAFMAGRIGFYAISETVERVCSISRDVLCRRRLPYRTHWPRYGSSGFGAAALAGLMDTCGPLGRERERSWNCLRL